MVYGVYKDLYGIFYHFFEKWADTPKYLTTGLTVHWSYHAFLPTLTHL